MPIVVNGTTIPTNVANALNVNGTNITSVVCNGTTVWTQSLFSAIWSGNALATVSPANYTIGLLNSNSNYRFKNDIFYGSVCSVSSLGIFSGDSFASTDGISVSSNLIRVSMKLGGLGITYGGWVTFNINNCAFTGTSYVWQDDGEGGLSATFETSGGLLRYGAGGSTAIMWRSPYISLT